MRYSQHYYRTTAAAITRPIRNIYVVIRTAVMRATTR